MADPLLIAQLKQAIIDEIEARQAVGMLDLDEYAEAMATAIVDRLASSNTIADSFYEHDQNLPLAEWTVNHELGKFPAVAVVDSAGSLVFGDVEYIDLDNLIIRFSAAFSGKAYLN